MIGNRKGSAILVTRNRSAAMASASASASGSVPRVEIDLTAGKSPKSPKVCLSLGVKCVGFPDTPAKEEGQALHFRRQHGRSQAASPPAHPNPPGSESPSVRVRSPTCGCNA